jgi:hypothetical protein
MDIRNINEQVPQVEETEARILQEMYVLGIEQFSGYKSIEKLPDYPLDINNPKSQVILKDFIGRVIEELTEGFESTDEVVSIYRDYGWNNDCLTSEEYTRVLNHLANANEEQADALGFFFTLLLYSNILPEDILKYQDAKSLFEVMAIGVKDLLIKYPDHRSVRKYPILSPTDWAREDRAEYDKIVSYTPGFHEMSEISHENEKLYLWEVIYELNKARNLLKCRPWKQTQVMTKEIDFQESLVKSFYLYMGFLAMNGFTPCGLFSLFFKKQRLNLWRQNTNY